MGEVWLAQDNELGVQRALKFAPPEVAADARSVAMLKREAIAGTSLAHPNIVRIFDFATDPAAMESAVVMEVVDGKSLAELQAKRIEETGNAFFEPEEIETWLRDACAALDYAHGEGRVHRDLKPQNLMVETATKRLKIMDFGISRRIGDSFSQLTGKDSSGTLPYMSPQQVMGDPPNASDDIYGLGATFYDLLSGSPPFIGGALEMQVREKMPTSIQQRRVEVNASSGKAVPTAWEAAVMGCLEKQREKRPGSFHALQHLLNAPVQTAGNGPKSTAPAADDIYAEYLQRKGDGEPALRLYYFPVSPRGTWMDRNREAENIARHQGVGAYGIQAASSSLAVLALTQRHRLESGVVLCCEVRPDHVCCSWLEIDAGDGLYEERASWTIESAGLDDERLAARVWSDCESICASISADVKTLTACAVTHSCSATRARARGLSGRLPNTVWLWEDELPAAIVSAQTGPHQTGKLLLQAVPHALAIRLPDQSLMPVIPRFTIIPKKQTLEISCPGDQEISSLRLEVVEETGHGLVPVISQVLHRDACVIQNGMVTTRAVVEIDSNWRLSLSLEPPEDAKKTQAPQETPAQAEAAQESIPREPPRQRATAKTPKSPARPPTAGAGDRLEKIWPIFVTCLTLFGIVAKISRMDGQGGIPDEVVLFVVGAALLFGAVVFIKNRIK